MPLFDCVVVGAGPAGASAAYHLSQRGHSVLLLEKASLPRYKPCGGGVSPEIAQWFDFDFEPVISQKVTRARYTWKLGEVIESELEAPIWMVRRNEFDHYLVQQAQRQGALLKDKTKVIRVNFEGDRWKVETSHSETSHSETSRSKTSHGETYEGTYLIAADGGRGPMAKWLGFKNRKTSIAGAIEIEPAVPVEKPETVHFEFGLLKNGYVWNFPKADGYSIGSGLFASKQRKGRDLIEPTVAYAKAFDVDGEQEAKFGHPVYLWDGHQTLHTHHALLAGEAACVVDPFTAEGIRPSMFTGVKAAEAIASALQGDLAALSNYTQTIQTELGSEMKLASRLAKAFYTAPHLSYKTILNHPSATNTMLKVFVGELKYSDVIQKALRRLSGGLIAR